MRGFRYAEDGPVADLTVEAEGSTLEEAFENAALAMFNAITPLEGIEARESRSIEAEGDDIGALLFNFLDELIYVNDVDLLVFSGIEVEIDRDRMRLRAECRGEAFDVERHPQGIVIKAVTFHQMRIEERGGGWSIRVVLDT
jgi:SHS2 domain-containing protein